jgi:hypothetical protein
VPRSFLPVEDIARDLPLQHPTFDLHPNRFYFVIELKKEENVLRPRVAYTLVNRFPLGFDG